MGKSNNRHGVNGLYFKSIDESVRIVTKNDLLGLIDVSNDTIKKLVECLTKLSLNHGKESFELDSYARHRGIVLKVNNLRLFNNICFILGNGDKSETLYDLVNLSNMTADKEGITRLKNWKCGDINIDIETYKDNTAKLMLIPVVKE